VTVCLVTTLTRRRERTGVSLLTRAGIDAARSGLVQVVFRTQLLFAFLVKTQNLTADPKLREMEIRRATFQSPFFSLNARSEAISNRSFAAVEQQQMGAMVSPADTMFSNEAQLLAGISPS